MPQTITFSEKNNGWTSFHSWLPDAMCRLNNRFFTIKDGQLYMHNDKENPVHNTFYGVKYPSKISTFINQSPGEDKIFKACVLEGNKKWSAVLTTNLSKSTLSANEFETKGSREFAYLRKNEDSLNLKGHSAQGIGVIVSSSGLNISFGNLTPTTSIGDSLYQLNGSNNELIGVISSINGNTVSVTSIVTTPVNGYFAFSKKVSRIEGGEMRGYYMKVELENNDDERAELFAIGVNTVKSYV